jgi:hypothetical protein
MCLPAILTLALTLSERINTSPIVNHLPSQEPLLPRPHNVLDDYSLAWCFGIG